jgi:hypothetical protein
MRHGEQSVAMSILAKTKASIAELRKLNELLAHPEKLDEAMFDRLRHNTDDLLSLHEVRLGVFVAWLAAASSKRVVELTQAADSTETMLRDLEIDKYDEHALLVAIRKQALTWNPLVTLYTLVRDDASLGAFPDKWAAMQERIQPAHLLFVTHRVVRRYDTTSCPDMYLFQALALYNHARYLSVFNNKLKKVRMPTKDVAETAKSITAMFNKTRGMAPGAPFIQKRQWLVVRLAMPLEATSLREFMNGRTNPGSVGRVVDWTKTRFPAMFECARDSVLLMRLTISEDIKEADVMESKTQKRVPLVPNCSDLMAELNEWLTTAPGRHVFALPACFGNSTATQNIVPWLNEILTLVMFADKMDLTHNLGVEDSFLWNYVLLHSDIEKHEPRWATNQLTRGMRKIRRCPQIYIAPEGFAVIFQGEITDFTSNMMEACAVWYTLCLSSGGMLATGQRMMHWAEVK